MSNHMIKVACVQLNSGQNIAQNCAQAASHIRKAVSDGATVILTPEVTDQVVSNRAEVIDQAYSAKDHPALSFFSDLAKDLSVTLVIGSICVRVDDEHIKSEEGCTNVLSGRDDAVASPRPPSPSTRVDAAANADGVSEGGHKTKLANRCYVFADDGTVQESYDKIHLYDVDLPTGESHRESKLFISGDRAVVSEVCGIKMGLSICYDLRFPHLYRNLAQNGAQILFVPAAFTVPTGQAHWETLLRARAIENGAFVVAAAQSGDHDGARQTYGHSMIISPWGEVLSAMQDGVGYIAADLDMTLVAKARSAIPALQHDRNFKEI